ncbi:MAG: amino acid ABC transporter permease [Parvibaculaceae bacterium]
MTSVPLTFLDRLPFYIPGLLKGCLYTLSVSAVALLIATAIGILVAMAARSDKRPLRAAMRAYVELGRAVPELVQIYVWYYLLANLGIVLPPIVAGIVALSVAFGPFFGEVFRAGVASVEETQWEAAQVLGMERATAWRRIILPQAVRAILPIWTGYVISMFKATSLLSFIAIPELFGAAKAIAASNYQYFEVFALVMLLYLMMAYPTVWIIRAVEHRLRIDKEPAELRNALQPNAI